MSKKLIDKITKNKLYLFIGLVFIMVLLILLFINPTIIGYTTYQDMKKQNVTISEYTQTINEFIYTQENLENEINNYLNKINLLKTQIDKKNKEIYSSNNQMTILESKIGDSENNCDEEKEIIKKGNNKEIKDLEEDITSLNEQIEELEYEIDDLNNNVNQIQEIYSLLAENSANNMCCKMKVDNSDIKYYKIINNKIVCLESGYEKISCNI
jgi:peptidoglycan hydrolase CwlO-like protein